MPVRRGQHNCLFALLIFKTQNRGGLRCRWILADDQINFTLSVQYLRRGMSLRWSHLRAQSLSRLHFTYPFIDKQKPHFWPISGSLTATTRELLNYTHRILQDYERFPVWQMLTPPVDYCSVPLAWGHCAESRTKDCAYNQRRHT